ncbi:amidohydrolase family protein [Nakamurella antarctica]|uniref:Amidohydrolase family protein n=1 Tax=Nakamurella antarctica TaxID=1902245 RepID=A0A3G8ZVY3_9ACTN|nr:amidohydrolase family protein [Nakamurella antarctica]AZI57821.1 amidohydrolase family protein [Nakamurella antarctica]
MTALRVTGVDPTTGESVAHWIAGGVYVDSPVRGAREVAGFVLPGFADAHCHIGYCIDGVTDLAAAEQQARLNLASGVTVIRDCGSPLDTRPLVDRADLPVLIRAGRHIARPKRYIRGLGIDLEDPTELVAEVGRQAEYGDGWVKLVGDWIDRDRGDLAPLWTDAVLVDAIALAHEKGARVTAHVFGEDAIPALLAAGIDCLEHATGLTSDTIETVRASGVHIVPTLINIENFPSFAAAAGEKYPTYAKHMRDLYSRADATIAAVVEAGIAVHAGTDAGGYIEHGRIVDEVTSLLRVGMTPTQALKAATWDARQWLGVADPELGGSADLVVYASDPRIDWDTLREPLAVIRAGVIS